MRTGLACVAIFDQVIIAPYVYINIYSPHSVLYNRLYLLLRFTQGLFILALRAHMKVIYTHTHEYVCL
jgi:hypothetical protein